ncbi:MAG: efflux RND transporter periplasmic adaptor subunit [Armatimonadota bacterium]|nr:efflux RND transporter periplasmic adaptor subunit [Armatimonadota bacterium]MDR7507932.1 efflux RND transporter periplasmic adaptor subunit [Armatimonadota bacterium]MDR7581901.1 efflux RND transporter periplasmic adaptor subunit [Armatimonadota bacterium]
MAYRRGVALTAAVLVAALAAWGAAAWRRGPSPDAVRASGIIEADQVTVASKVAGRIASLEVDEGDAVRAGQVVVALDSREADAQLQQARAALEAARARLAQAQAALVLQQRQVDASVAQARAALEAARARVPQAEQAEALTASQVDLAVAQARAALEAARATARSAEAAWRRAEDDLARLEPLFRDGAVSAQQVEAARAARDAARAQYEAAAQAAQQAEAALRLAEANRQLVAIRGRDVEAARAQVRQAEAAVAAARAGQAAISQRRADVQAAAAQVAQAEATVRLLQTQRDTLVIRSPLAGVVLVRHARAGEVVTPGTPILTVGTLDQLRLRLYLPLPQLGRVAVGQRVEVTTDAFPGRVFAGTVTEISQQAEFTPRNVQTPEERVKMVFAVTVTLPNPDHLLKPGMPADAVIQTRGRGPADTRSLTLKVQG